jgi:hypothetical protein
MITITPTNQWQLKYLLMIIHSSVIIYGKRLVISESKHGLFRGQDNASEWSYIPIWTVVSLSYHYNNAIEQMLISLIQNRLYHHLIKMLPVLTTRSLKKELNNTYKAGLKLCSQWFKFISTNEKGQWEQKLHPDVTETLFTTNIL